MKPVLIDGHLVQRSFCGRLKTWDGKICGRLEWDRLTEWQKFGPDGRMFCGIRREWVDPKEIEK